MDSIVVALFSGVIAPIVAVSVWMLASRSEGAVDLLDRATGGPLDEQAPVVRSWANACRSCGMGYPIASSAAFCRHCGRRLNGKR